MLKPDYIDIDGDGNKTESMKEAVKQAESSNDREPAFFGGLKKKMRAMKEKAKLKAQQNLVPEPLELKPSTPNILGMSFMPLQGYAEGGDVDEQMSMLMGQQEPEQETLPEVSMEPETPMEPDDEMEDNYLDFIIDEALSEEEEDMLMSKLEQDEQLSMLFDKVIEVASEFAGSGPVEGPGTGVSDSIPARLSDGEFVFTAKATEEIGASELMRMMKDAEAMADKRQDMANGGEMEEDETVVLKGDDEPVRQEIRVVKETVDPLRGIKDSNEIGQAINQQMLLDPDQKHVRS